MAAIGLSGFFKYLGDPKRDRIPLLLNKIKNSSPFTIKTKEGNVDLVIDPSELSRVEAWTKNPSRNLKIKTMDERYPVIALNAIVKTGEFGGEAPLSREKVEQGQIAEISSQLEAFKAGKPSVKLKVGNRMVNNAAAVEKEKGTIRGRAPKSDLTVLDSNGNPSAWVSLKDHHFRWGGWQHLTSMPEISEWLDRIRKITNGEFRAGMSFGLKISENIANKIVFGKDFGGAPGISNVDLVLIGTPKIENGTLTGTRSYANGKTPSGGDEPYLVMRFTRDRSDLGFKMARAETNRISEGRKVIWLNTDADVDSAIRLFNNSN